jgi:hypothetical protein
MEVLNGKEKLLFYLMILKSFKEMVTNYDTDPDKNTNSNTSLQHNTTMMFD